MQWNSLPACFSKHLTMSLLSCFFFFFEWVKVLQQDASCFHYPVAQERSKACLSVAQALRHHGPRENANISCGARAPRDLCCLFTTCEAQIVTQQRNMWISFPHAERSWCWRMQEEPYETGVRRKWFLFIHIYISIGFTTTYSRVRRWKGVFPSRMDASLGFS